MGKLGNFRCGLAPGHRTAFPLSPQTRILQFLKLKDEPPGQSESFFNL